MKSLKERLQSFKQAPTDVVGLDVGASGVKAVRMQKRDSEISVTAADVLSRVDLGRHAAEDAPPVEPLALPARLRARYGALALGSDATVVKLLTSPGAFDEKAQEKLVENLGIEDASRYRIAYKIIVEGHARTESRVLAVAMPDELARLGPLLLPAGFPVPWSVEFSGLAAFTSFLRTVSARHAEEAVAAMDFGASMSLFAIFNRGALALVRRFNFGSTAVLAKVRDSMGVDEETAQGIVTDGSFDISQPVAEVMEPLVKQLVVSRDFVERRENCHIAKIYVCGSLAHSPTALAQLKESLEMDADRWDPFEGLTVAPDALPEALATQRWRFAAAAGACLATFEES